MATQPSSMLTEAIAAARAGETTRARELLARLLRSDSSNAEYWVWMSAVVDSPRERIYCLESALRLDPTNRAALRGLVVLGARKPDEAELATAVRMPRRKFDFTLKSKPVEVEEPPEDTTLPSAPPSLFQPSQTIPWRTVGTVAIGVVAVAGSIFLLSKLIPQISAFLRSRPFGRAAELPQASATITNTLLPGSPTATPLPAATRVMRTPIPTELARTPLAFLVDITATPTPVFGVTPHSFEAYNAGINALTRDDYETALLYFDQVIDSDPGLADAHYFRGEALRLMGNRGEAILAYDKAVNLNEDYVPAYLGRALAFAARDQVNDAIADFDRALRRDPFNTRIHVEIGKFYASRGLWYKLESEMTKALDLGVSTPWIYIYLSESQLYQGNYEGALASALEGSADDPSMLEGYLAVGRAYVAWGINSFDQKHYESALWPLQTYLAYRSEDHRGWAALARAFAGLGFLDEAFDAANKALEIQERYGPAFLARSVVHMERGDSQAALDDLTLARRYSTETFDLLYLAGKAHYLNGDYEDALFNTNEATSAADDDLRFTNKQKKIAETYALLALIFETNPEGIDDAITRWRWILDLENVRPETRALAEIHLAELTGQGPTRTPTTLPSSTPTVAMETPIELPTSTSSP
ncbi:MAG: tetratricopeptide repeat protein [Anaerolineales bacterium]|nr:tetratricopeptide repeat protein [Anaerolineales bacterium]